MESNFDKYEQEFIHVCNTINRKIKQLPSFAGERKKVATREAENEIEEADQLLQQMEKEANNDQNIRARYGAKLRQYQGDISRYKKDLVKAATQTSSSQRDDLLGGASNDTQAQYMDQRSGLLAGTEKLNSGTDRLQNTHRIALQTETQGASVLSSLHGQRQQLVNANNRLDQVDDNMKRARTVMTGMARRVATNKLILALIILVLLGTNGLVIYLRWFR
eukprot:TRINITY_DN1302_c0_g1_i1.p1 TRINITY_DN1302_c0_g1~~TRINITY_DN1302_c0_g1_i1.p1  ORF type:complete len:220 (+),score=61.68 TRINITY_DN1302_c0_g1_i1:95-754(+)